MEEINIRLFSPKLKLRKENINKKKKYKNFLLLPTKFYKIKKFTSKNDSNIFRKFKNSTFYNSKSFFNKSATKTSRTNKINYTPIKPEHSKYSFSKLFINCKNSLSKINPNKKKINDFYFENKASKSVIDSEKKNCNQNSKISCGVDTKDLFRTPFKQRLKFKFSKSKNKSSFLAIKNINEYFITPCKEKNNSMIDNNYNNSIYDKYAYIYLSANSESIKFSRRINYNPLDV